jgi:hypothetical protein
MNSRLCCSAKKHKRYNFSNFQSRIFKPHRLVRCHCIVCRLLVLEQYCQVLEEWALNLCLRLLCVWYLNLTSSKVHYFSEIPTYSVQPDETTVQNEGCERRKPIRHCPYIYGLNSVPSVQCSAVQCSAVKCSAVQLARQ